MPKSAIGFVYVLTNKSMPGLVKIGYTRELVEDRAKALFKTGVPSPFEVEFRVISAFPHFLEALVHEDLEYCRETNTREFFRIPPEEAIDAILSNRQFIDGISTHDLAPKLLINKGDHALLSLRAGQVFVVLSFPDGKQEISDIWQAHTNGDTLELFGTDAKYTSSFANNEPFSLDDPLPFFNRTGTAENDGIIGKERLIPGDRLLWMDDSDPDKFRFVFYEMNTYCQIIARTRQPKISDNGMPLILNDLTRDLNSIPIKKCVLETLALGLPKVLTEKLTNGEIEMENAALERPIAEDWLPALLKKSKTRSSR